MRTRLLTLLIVLFACVAALSQDNNVILIGAASDLKFALDSVILIYKRQQPNVDIRVSYGSSGKLFEQISNGAPFDLYFSADKSYPEKLKEKGLVSSEVKTYGFGKIAIWSMKGNASDDPTEFLLRDEIKKIAIANPLHAPYGKSAEQAMRFYKIYDRVKGKLVFGENVSQTAQFVVSGAADAGIIALSLVLSPEMQKLGGHYTILNQESYKPLEQAYVVLANSKNKKTAQEFFSFVQTDLAKKVLGNFGFSDKP